MPNGTLHIRTLLPWIALLIFTAMAQSAYATPPEGSKGQILVITSYNPDTRRMSDFIVDFEKKVIGYGLPFDIVVEDMGCKGIEESPTWGDALEGILERYDTTQLKAVVLLGQEAWATFLTRKSFPSDIPFFGCFASAQGIVLPEGPVNSDWMPESANMLEIADRLGHAGGYINSYDLDKNIELIVSLYPYVEKIAFVSDNTYGGISLQAYVRSKAESFPGLDFIFIDGRNSEERIREQISHLPGNTAILLGTWRVGRDGQYLMFNSLNELFQAGTHLPIFTLSGTGLGNPAVGGYIPHYSNGALEITRQLKQYYEQQDTSVIEFVVMDGEYRFDKGKIDEFGISEYRLPKKSIVTDDNEALYRQYRRYVLAALAALVILSCFALFLYMLYRRNKALKDDLLERERQLIGARDRAEESDRLKSAFLANMSHEIRTPLNAIVGFSSLLKDQLSDEDRAEYCDIINANSELMLALISDILDISRLETGKMQFQYSKADVVALCNQAIMSTGQVVKPKVKCSYDGEFKSLAIYTDQQRLLQVLNNLLINARKFTEEGSITIGLELKEEGRTLQFSVTDTGCGIPPDKQALVFNRFEKLNEFKQGTGLGLAICKQIVRLFGGEIWVDGGYTGGCRIIFTHPVLDEPPADSE